MMKYILIAGGVALAIAAATIWIMAGRLDDANTKLGALANSNKQLTGTINAKSGATRDRANTESQVRRLAPADILERLR